MNGGGRFSMPARRVRQGQGRRCRRSGWQEMVDCKLIVSKRIIENLHVFIFKSFCEVTESI